MSEGSLSLAVQQELFNNQQFAAPVDERVLSHEPDLHRGKEPQGRIESRLITLSNFPLERCLPHVLHKLVAPYQYIICQDMGKNRLRRNYRV